MEYLRKRRGMYSVEMTLQLPTRGKCFVITAGTGELLGGLALGVLGGEMSFEMVLLYKGLLA